MGDLGMAYQALRVATAVDTNHVEAFCNLGVLEMRKQASALLAAHYCQLKAANGPSLLRCSKLKHRVKQC
jgi:hypothetical protein